MTFDFYKYHGTGNDFIVIDDRERKFPHDDQQAIHNACQRRFGIGADGLILLRRHPEADFEMLYFNANGLEGSMCGNGGRCAVHFAHHIGLIEQHTRFMAVDGWHEAEVLPDQRIRLKMQDVGSFERVGEDFDLNTGSPHYVRVVDTLKDFDTYNEGKTIRNSEAYQEHGTNVNFMSLLESNELEVNTFERGVEDVTYSCGTGVVACSLVAPIAFPNLKHQRQFLLQTAGGKLEVSFEHGEQGYYNIWLTGPAVSSFQGRLEIGADHSISSL